MSGVTLKHSYRANHKRLGSSKIMCVAALRGQDDHNGASINSSFSSIRIPNTIFVKVWSPIPSIIHRRTHQTLLDYASPASTSPSRYNAQ